MAKILPSAVFGFTILCLACVLNALEDDIGPNQDDSSKNLADFPSASFSNPSSGRIIRPSAWSKEEKDYLKSGGDKNMRNKDQDMFFFDEESSLWNMRKFLRYFAYLLSAVNENNDDSLDKFTDNAKFDMQKSVNNNNPANKSENNVETEKTNSGNDDTMKKSKYDGSVQNSGTDTLSKPEDDEKVQNSGSNDNLSNLDDGKEQQSSTTDISNKSDDNEKIEDSPNADTQSKSSNGGRMQNISKNASMNRRKPSKNLKTKTRDSMDKNFVDKSEKQDLGNIDDPEIQKPSDYGETRNFLNSYSLSNIKPVENSIHNDPKDKSEHNVETETQNPMTSIAQDSNGQIKSSTDGEMQESTTNSPLSESTDNRKRRKYSNRDFLNREKFRNEQQGPMNEDHFKKSMNDIKVQNPLIHDTQPESISTQKSNEPKEKLRKHASKDYEVCSADEILDTTVSYSSETKANEHEVENDKEIVKYDLNENEMDEDETEDDYEINNDDEDEIEDDFVNDNNSDNKIDTNPSGIENENVNENNDDNGGNELAKNSQNLQAANITDKATLNTSTTLPKFLRKVIQGSQDHFISQSSNKQNNNNIDAATLAVAKSQNLTNQEKLLKEFQLNNNEFLDTYINNPEGRTIDGKKEPSNTEVLTPSRNNSKNEEIALQAPIIENNYEYSKSSNTTSPNNENIEDRKMPYDQSQNTLRNFTSENNVLPLPIFSLGRSDANSGPLKVGSPEAIQNTLASDNILVSPIHEGSKTREIEPLNSFPVEEIPYRTNMLQPSEAIEHYGNAFAEPVASNFQNNEPSLKAVRNSAPTTNQYRPNIINSFPMSPDKAIPIQNEGYLSDRYSNYNIQDAKIPGIINEFDQMQKPALEQDIVTDIQNQDTPRAPNKITYFRNYDSTLPINSQNTEKPAQNAETSSNYLTSNDLQSYLAINPIHNEDYPIVDIKNGINNMDKIMPQNQLDELKLQNQINNANNEEILNQQTEPTNQPFQGKLAEPQQSSSQNNNGETSPQSTINNDNKMISETLPIQNNPNETELPISEKRIKNSNRLPENSFNNTDDNLENSNSESKTSVPVIPKNIATKSPFLEAKTESSKPLNIKDEDDSYLDTPEGQEQKASDSNSNIGNSDDSSNQDYDNEDAIKVNKEIAGPSDEKDSNDEETEHDYVNENNDDDKTDGEDENEEEDKTDGEDENEMEDKIENETEEDDKNENEGEDEEEDKNENEEENEEGEEEKEKKEEVEEKEKEEKEEEKGKEEIEAKEKDEEKKEEKREEEVEAKEKDEKKGEEKEKGKDEVEEKEKDEKKREEEEKGKDEVEEKEKDNEKEEVEEKDRDKKKEEVDEKEKEKDDKKKEEKKEKREEEKEKEEVEAKDEKKEEEKGMEGVEEKGKEEIEEKGKEKEKEEEEGDKEDKKEENNDNDEDEDEENDEDKTESRSDYDRKEEDINSQKPQVEVINERTHDKIATDPSVSQEASGQQIYPESQPPISQINNNENIAPEDDKNQNKTNEENPMQVTEENPSRVENDATKQQNLESELPSPNQEGKFGTILEYIYRFSNNPLFKGIKEE